MPSTCERHPSVPAICAELRFSSGREPGERGMTERAGGGETHWSVSLFVLIAWGSTYAPGRRMTNLLKT